MALFEYICVSCRNKFEIILTSSDPSPGNCPQCQGTQLKKLISSFTIGGQGDLRESTFHGCHDCHVPSHDLD